MFIKQKVYTQVVYKNKNLQRSYVYKRKQKFINTLFLQNSFTITLCLQNKIQNRKFTNTLCLQKKARYVYKTNLQTSYVYKTKTKV